VAASRYRRHARSPGKVDCSEFEGQGLLSSSVGSGVELGSEATGVATGRIRVTAAWMVIHGAVVSQAAAAKTSRPHVVARSTYHSLPPTCMNLNPPVPLQDLWLVFITHVYILTFPLPSVPVLVFGSAGKGKVSCLSFPCHLFCFLFVASENIHPSRLPVWGGVDEEVHLKAS
jgi:hypothetical protein